jgi:receptor-type tyrosine-protein phosphatase F
VNRDKNRYANVLPYDFNRVLLPSRDAIDGSDFINGIVAPPIALSLADVGFDCVATYLLPDFDQDGDEQQIGSVARRSCSYIATQGPKDNTTADFWRMLWTEHVYSLVMLGKYV